MSTTGKELSHRSDGNKVVDVSGSQRILGMEISEAVEDIRSAVAGLVSPPSEVCRNLDRVYRKSKQTNLFSKEDVARQKEPPEDVARGGYSTVRGYGESTGPGQDTNGFDAKDPRRDTEDAARTRRDATFLEQMGRNAAEAANTCRSDLKPQSQQRPQVIYGHTEGNAHDSN